MDQRNAEAVAGMVIGYLLANGLGRARNAGGAACLGWGTPGERGPQGFQGPPGEPGTTGEQGQQGIPGRRASQAAGAAGLQGRPVFLARRGHRAPLASRGRRGHRAAVA